MQWLVYIWSGNIRRTVKAEAAFSSLLKIEFSTIGVSVMFPFLMVSRRHQTRFCLWAISVTEEHTAGSEINKFHLTKNLLWQKRKVYCNKVKCNYLRRFFVNFPLCILYKINFNLHVWWPYVYRIVVHRWQIEKKETSAYWQEQCHAKML